MPSEYRVVWKRLGQKRKVKRFANLKTAQRRVTLMGPEPWLALKVDPDELRCCSGYECGCNGETWRQHLIGERSRPKWGGDDLGMPAIEYVFIESRPTAPWERLES